jgi:hypothetical protein
MFEQTISLHAYLAPSRFRWTQYVVPWPPLPSLEILRHSCSIVAHSFKRDQNQDPGTLFFAISLSHGVGNFFNLVNIQTFSAWDECKWLNVDVMSMSLLVEGEGDRYVEVLNLIPTGQKKV